MPTITPYRSIAYGDAPALAAWSAAHARRHLAEQRAASLQGAGAALVFVGAGAITFVGSGAISWNGIAASTTGASLPAPLLEGDPTTAPWHARHLQVHQGLTRASSPTQGYAVQQLASGWKDAASFGTWMRLHTQIHTHIDRQLGITG